MSWNHGDLAHAARVCHEINSTFCKYALGDHSHLPWDLAPSWQRGSAVQGVANVWRADEAGTPYRPEDSHENWLEQKRADGWVYGAVKDPDRKEHPCMVPYSQLPQEQRAKDALFVTTARALRPGD